MTMYTVIDSPLDLAKIKRVECVVRNVLLTIALIGLTLFVIGV